MNKNNKQNYYTFDYTVPTDWHRSNFILKYPWTFSTNGHLFQDISSRTHGNQLKLNGVPSFEVRHEISVVPRNFTPDIDRGIGGIRSHRNIVHRQRRFSEESSTSGHLSDVSTISNATKSIFNQKIPNGTFAKSQTKTNDGIISNGTPNLYDEFEKVSTFKIVKSPTINMKMKASSPSPLCCSNTSYTANRKWMIALVTLALFLDNLLQTSVVPIMPAVVLKVLSIKDQNQTTTDNHDYTGRNFQVSVVLFIKPLTQLCLYPLMSKLLLKIGAEIPHVVGLFVTSIFALIFALGNNYILLCFSGIIHGCGSAVVVASGFVLVTQMNGNEQQITRAITLVNYGIAFGFLVGYPYGGLAYTFIGHVWTFVILASSFVSLAVLGCLVIRPRLKPPKVNESTGSYLSLLKDKFVIIAFYLTFLNLFCVSAQDTTEPTWMKDTLSATEWQIGLIFVADACGYFMMNTCLTLTADRVPSWIFAYVGLFLIGVSAIALPFANSVPTLIGPHFGFGLMQGSMDSTAYALMGRQAMSEHGGVFGKVYTLSGFADSLGYISGSAISGNIVQYIGFKWIMRGIGFICLASIPVACVLTGLGNSKLSRKGKLEKKWSRNSESMRGRIFRMRRFSVLQFPTSSINQDNNENDNETNEMDKNDAINHI